MELQKRRQRQLSAPRRAKREDERTHTQLTDRWSFVWRIKIEAHLLAWSFNPTLLLPGFDGFSLDAVDLTPSPNLPIAAGPEMGVKPFGNPTEDGGTFFAVGRSASRVRAVRLLIEMGWVGIGMDGSVPVGESDDVMDAIVACDERLESDVVELSSRSSAGLTFGNASTRWRAGGAAVERAVGVIWRFQIRDQAVRGTSLAPASGGGAKRAMRAGVAPLVLGARLAFVTSVRAEETVRIEAAPVDGERGRWTRPTGVRDLAEEGILCPTSERRRSRPRSRSAAPRMGTALLTVRCVLARPRGGGSGGRSTETVLSFVGRCFLGATSSVGSWALPTLMALTPLALDQLARSGRSEFPPTAPASYRSLLAWRFSCSLRKLHVSSSFSCSALLGSRGIAIGIRSPIPCENSS